MNMQGEQIAGALEKKRKGKTLKNDSIWFIMDRQFRSLKENIIFIGKSTDCMHAPGWGLGPWYDVKRAKFESM